tara:strand:+ start:2871 stop:3863 length:993 start_codon:yes stop_codon:yes gene_type:complete
MRKLSIVLFYSILFSTGKYGDSFLKIGTSARDIGIGQAIVANMGNASGVNVSPATISGLGSRTLYLLMVNQYGLAEFYSGGIVLPLKDNQYASFNITGLLVDDIEQRPDLISISSVEQRRDIIRELFAQGYNSFHNSETAFTASFVKRFSGTLNMGLNYNNYEIPIGVNTRLFKKKLHDKEAYGIGFDIGGIFSMGLGDILNYDWMGKIGFGVSINNIYGTHLFWSNDLKDIIPMQVISGFSYEQPIKFINSKILVLSQKNNLFPNQLQVGMEIIILDKIFLRIGNQNGLQQGGLGIATKIAKLSNVRIDYSFGGHDLGDTHRLGFELKF